jgi:hypothetical protein
MAGEICTTQAASLQAGSVLGTKLSGVSSA